MANLAAIKAEVTRIVEERITELDDAVVTHVQRAQRAIEDFSAFKIQEASATFQYDTSNEFLNLPSDWIAIKEQPFYLKKSTDTQYIRLIDVRNINSLGNRGAVAAGQPKYWSQDVEVIRIFPRSDDLGPSLFNPGAYEIQFSYFKRLITLVSDSQTNWWTDNMDDVLTWKAAASVFAELRDPLAQFWNGLAVGRFKEILNQFKRNKIRDSDFRIFPTQSLSARRHKRFGRQIVTRIP